MAARIILSCRAAVSSVTHRTICPASFAVQKRTWFGFGGHAEPENTPLPKPWYQIQPDDDSADFEEPREKRLARIELQRQYFALVDAGEDNVDAKLAPKAVDFAITHKDHLYAQALSDQASELGLSEVDRQRLVEYIDEALRTEI